MKSTHHEANPPKFNSEFSPEKWRLEDDPFLLGFGNFSGAKMFSLLGNGHIFGTVARAHSNFQQIQAGEGFLSLTLFLPSI